MITVVRLSVGLTDPNLRTGGLRKLRYGSGEAQDTGDSWPPLEIKGRGGFGPSSSVSRKTVRIFREFLWFLFIEKSKK